MNKKWLYLLFFILFVSINATAIDGWIRINQAGYLPNAQKSAVFISESPQFIRQFSIYDALTNEEIAQFNSIHATGAYQQFQSSFILDFSSIHQQGAYYIKAGLYYSPVFRIGKNVYLGSTDLIMNYLRKSRSLYSPVLDTLAISPVRSAELVKEKNRKISRTGLNNHKNSGIEESTYEAVSHNPEYVDVRGGWRDPGTFVQFSAQQANTVFQLLFAYQLFPHFFSDLFNQNTEPKSDKIPDILNEARWGLEWLLKMFPNDSTLYYQVGLWQPPYIFRNSFTDKKNYEKQAINPRPVFEANGKHLIFNGLSNMTNGIASLAGKFTSAMALGADVFDSIDPVFAHSLAAKAIEAYELGEKYPGVCQSVPTFNGVNMLEDNWADDMELAAAELYRLTYKTRYLFQAIKYARLEPVTPWMCSDTAADYQWYPYINIGHYILSNSENPRFRNEFVADLRTGLERINQSAENNPFHMGIPMIHYSANLTASLAEQCLLYRSLTGDSTFVEMENSLRDWLFGCNPWGYSFMTGFPQFALRPEHVFADITSEIIDGGLVSGPVTASVFQASKETSKKNCQGTDDPLKRYQSAAAVYHDCTSDLLTNSPTMDGTATMAIILAGLQQNIPGYRPVDLNQYKNGALVRTDSTKKTISLVFVADTYADGFKTIRNALKKNQVTASFFFTGDFLQKHRSIVRKLKNERYYIGGASERNDLYCSPLHADSLLFNKDMFIRNLRSNYGTMKQVGIERSEAPFFMPSRGCYNDSISHWLSEMGIQLISFTPSTLCFTDNSIPEMRSGYFSSTEIYNSIMNTENETGLNGFILAFHLGTDKMRRDKFLPRLNNLLTELKKKGYRFTNLYQATNVFDAPTTKNKKRKN